MNIVLTYDCMIFLMIMKSNKNSYNEFMYDVMIMNSEPARPRVLEAVPIDIVMSPVPCQKSYHSGN